MSTWATVRLGHVAELINGDRGKNYPPEGDFVDEGIPFINAGHLSGGEVDFSRMNYISESRFRLLGSGKTRENDILYCLRGSLGKTAVVRRKGNGAIASSLVIVRPSNECEVGYLYHFLTSPLGRLEMRKFDNGSSQPNLSADSVKNYRLPLPSPGEQRHIADILDKADALRAKRRAALAQLDELMQSIFIDMFGDPASNPRQWPLQKLGDLLESTSYGTSEKATSSGEFPVLRMNNITRSGEIDLTDLKYMSLDQGHRERYVVRTGDVLFNRTNSVDLVGKSAIFRHPKPMAYAGYLIRLRVTAENDSEYVAAFLNTPYSKRVLRGMCKSIIGMANINATELQTIRISQPPFARQRQFAGSVRAVEAIRLTYRASLLELDALFTSLQHRAFRGEL